eukprot:Em0016g725a
MGVGSSPGVRGSIVQLIERCWHWSGQVHIFRLYLYGKRFTLRMDHSCLKWLHNFKEPEGQVARWLETLAEFDCEVVHRPSKQHQNADALSRKMCKQCGTQVGGDEITLEGQQNSIEVSATQTVLPNEGHLGVRKTLEKIQHQFYWPGQRKDVDMWCGVPESLHTDQGKNLELGRRKHLTSGGNRSVALPADFNKFTWKPSAGPSPVHMEVQCKAHLCSHGGLVQGPSPVHMKAQCRVHLLNQVQGMQHSWVAASQGYILKESGLKDQVSTLIICIQAGRTTMYVGPMQTARDLRGHPAALQTLS